MAKAHRPISTIQTKTFANYCRVLLPERSIAIVIVKLFLGIAYPKTFISSTVAVSEARHWMTSARRWASYQKMRTRLRHVVAATARVLGARRMSAPILIETFAVERANHSVPCEMTPINVAPRHVFLQPRAIPTGVAIRIRNYGRNLSRPAILDVVALMSSWKFQRVHRPISIDGKRTAPNRQKNSILLLHTQVGFWKSKGDVAPTGYRLPSSLKSRMRTGLSERRNESPQPIVAQQRNIRPDSEAEQQIAERHSLNVKSTLLQRGAQQDIGTAPPLLDARRIPTATMRPHTQCQIPVSSDSKRGQLVPTGKFHERHRNASEVENERELPGAGTNKCASLTFLRSGVQILCDVANRSVFGCRRLFHQKAREHCSCGFVKPLFEKSINFFLEIGRMIQPGKFKRLECWDCGLLKILPRWADTSGHLRVSLGRYGSKMCIPQS